MYKKLLYENSFNPKLLEYPDEEEINHLLCNNFPNTDDNLKLDLIRFLKLE